MVGFAQCKSVLIVEDEPTIRENMKLILELEGYPVYTASNGEEGLHILHSIPHPCLILLDLFMPVMNGMEFLDKKNSDDTIASIPVCIISGVSERPNLSRVQAFIKKPIDFDWLLNFVRKYCSTSEMPTGACGEKWQI